MDNNAIRAIRRKCLDCSAGSAREVRLCPISDCPLWNFRMGNRPSTTARRRPELLDPVAVASLSRREASGEGDPCPVSDPPPNALGGV